MIVLCTVKEGGATASFVCKPGKITLARLARINGEYIMQIATGEALNRSRKAMNGVRDRWPQIFIKLEADYSEFLKTAGQIICIGCMVTIKMN